MITDNTYYIGDIYLPHAKPTVTSLVTSVKSDLDLFIDEYEEKCLIECLGYSLAALFIAQLDNNTANGLIDGADEKWNELLNGSDYTDEKGVAKKWKGIRYKRNSLDEKPTASLLAYFVYFHFEENKYLDITSNGVSKTKTKNADNNVFHFKAVKAYRKFVDLVVGLKSKTKYYVKGDMIGIDYSASNNVKPTLFDFINSKNTEVGDYYPEFSQGNINAINDFGL